MRPQLLTSEPKTGAGGAYLPDLPGVVAGGQDREEVERLIKEGVAIYIEETKQGLPEPVATAGTISV